MLKGIIELENLTADPTTGLVAGLMYYNTTDNKVRIYDGSSWGDL